MTQPTVKTLRNKAREAMQVYADAFIEERKPIKVSELKTVGFQALDGKEDGTGISRAFRAYIEAEAFKIVRAHNDRITIRIE